MPGTAFISLAGGFTDGTVYVIDTEVETLTPEAIVAVNDLGPGGETWTLATLTYARKRLYAHTMKELICIEADDE